MLILASKSPRRQEILSAAGIPFVIRTASISEFRQPAEPAPEYVRRLAREKGEAVNGGPLDIVLAADTVVVVGAQVLEKPRDPEDAVRMLGMLAGREHSVLTGIYLRGAGKTVQDLSETRVRFSPLDEQEIRAYVASGEPMDKAGGYGIQSLASKFVEHLDGCYFNVVGLPVSLVYRHLKTLENYVAQWAT
ncbi:MAG TPA: Maf family protein [Bryobacteraceae bacterium]|nr:Maf family protein [Bryobacteraceae bacterium]